jgi:Na+/H+ antiporter NhaD/arsenite permease-like protein
MDWFFPEGLYTLAMVGSFVFGAFALKLPIAVALAAAAVVGALAAGRDSRRHFVEGTSAILIPSYHRHGHDFHEIRPEDGLLESLAARVIRTFRTKPLLLSLGLMFIIMVPGMITGSSTAAVLTTGALVAPVLIKLGVPAVKTAAAIAMGAIYGMIAPPVNIPAMIIGGGIDMPYVGFALPLLVCTFPWRFFPPLSS